MNRHNRRIAESNAGRRALELELSRKVRANARLRLAAATSTTIAASYELESARERDRAGFTPDTLSCRPGCAACCDQVVMAQDLEAREILHHHPDVIASVIYEMPNADRDLTDLAESLGLDIECLDILNRDPLIKMQRQVLLDAWFALRRPCVFLDKKTRRCRVYAHRPLVCREHIVRTPPALCDDRTGTMQLDQFVSPAFLGTMDTQLEAAKRIGTPPRLGLLNTLILSIMKEEDLL